MIRKLVLLSALDVGDTLPTEFRIFRSGVNESSKGSDVFDEHAARAVMTEYAKQGVDLMIDLNHDSLDPATRRQRKDAGDAMGWFKVELRDDGSLWATDVRWTPEGEERLRAKKQRYISPAFLVEKKTRRVSELINIALVGMPATHGAEPLVMASRVETRASSYNEVNRALEAALFDKYPRNETDPGSNAYVCDTYPTSFVFEREGGYWQASYTYAAGEVQITSEPIKVVRQYVPAAEAAQMRARAFIKAARAETSLARK